MVWNLLISLQDVSLRCYIMMRDPLNNILYRCQMSMFNKTRIQTSPYMD